MYLVLGFMGDSLLKLYYVSPLKETGLSSLWDSQLLLQLPVTL